MPTYGLEKCASESSTNSNRKEKKLPAVSIAPARLIQLRNGECLTVSFLFSRFMTILYKRTLFGDSAPLRAGTPFGNGETALASLLKGAHVGDESFDVIVTYAFGRLHQGLAIFVFETVLNGLKRSIVFEFRLDGCVGVILGIHFLSHFGLPFAVGTVALGTLILVESFGVPGAQRSC